MVRPILTAEKLRELVHYDPLTGVFTRRVTTSSRGISGKVASTKSEGYGTLCLLSVLWRTNRLAWLYMTGEWPRFMIDHKNTIRSDDRWENLREATKAQNAMNSKKPSTNTSGLKGVSAKGRKWEAYVTLNRKKKSLGSFDCKAAAHMSYIVAADIHYGEFARAA